MNSPNLFTARITNLEFNGSTAMLNAYQRTNPLELESEARSYEGACQNEIAANFVWHFNPSFPIAKIAGPNQEKQPGNWHEWMRAEISAYKELEISYRLSGLLDGSLIEEPIILHIENDDIGHIWDGWHRCGASAVINRSNIPAIVGIRKPQIF